MKLSAVIRVSALSLFATLGVAVVHAQTVNVMFTNGGSYTGASPVVGSTSADQWHEVNTYYDYFLSYGVSALSDVNGVPTSYSFAEVTPFGNFFLGGIAGNGIPVFDSYAHAGDQASLSFIIGGLSAGAAYDFYIYTARNLGDSSEIQTSSVTLEGETLTTNYYGPQNEFIEGTNYVSFSGVEANSIGEIFFSVNGVAVLNGFTITSSAASAVPEPSTYAALAGLMAFGVVACRRVRARR